MDTLPVWMTEPTMKTKTGLNVSLVRAAPHALELYALIASDRAHLSNLTWAATIDLKGVQAHCEKPSVYVARVNREKVAGCLEFRKQPDGWYQIGYWVGKEFSGQGVAKAMLSNAVAGGYIDQHLFACVRQTNLKSRAVLESAGFRIFESVEGWHRLTRIVARPATQKPALPRPQLWDAWILK
jgi:RimJ/RimL family protein N-acetyltransferase